MIEAYCRITLSRCLEGGMGHDASRMVKIDLRLLEIWKVEEVRTSSELCT